jgi:ATP-dependent protease ClpP protease subunit
MAASIASVIAQAGDTRNMLTGSQMMIHDAHAIAAGTADDLEEFAEVLRMQNDIIAGIYAEAAGDGRKKPHFASLMSKETWMTPKEAVAEGLADSILKPATKTAADEPAKANVDWSAFVASATEIGAV